MDSPEAGIGERQDSLTTQCSVHLVTESRLLNARSGGLTRPACKFKKYLWCLSLRQDELRSACFPLGDNCDPTKQRKKLACAIYRKPLPNGLDRRGTRPPTPVDIYGASRNTPGCWLKTWD